MSRRLKAMGSPRYQTDGDPVTSGPGFGVALHPELLTVPGRWRRPRRVFISSMGDLLHARVPTSFIREVFEVVADNPRHDFLLLTKRSTRLPRLATELAWPDNLWVGVSVENADYLARVDHLRSVPARTRFVSAEPLLGPLSRLDLTGIHWLIAGGESGPAHRPVQLDWVRELRELCHTNGTSFFFKQVGGRTPKAGGRLLDGRTWDDIPDPRRTRHHQHAEPKAEASVDRGPGATNNPPPDRARPSLAGPNRTGDRS